MTLVMSAIFLLEGLISAIVPTTCRTISPPCEAAAVEPAANWLAWRALLALRPTVSLNVVSDALVCCSEAAWRSVRDFRWLLPAAICSLALATFCA